MKRATAVPLIPISYGTPPASAGVVSRAVETPIWEPGHSCRLGDLIVYDGHIYRCLASHVFVTGWEPPNTPALWQLVK
ncbi:carbohydrate-binding protein [Streptosporangium saharense]|uniref:Chitin-binding type-3 domain-containing protein n=1 Tax=Streptosporangium saharense TaxID=1706840 RepID=A0A7W7QV50_9ACTN|nr:carbohydrate-binding protein [Streptosporangium saharense]MBB4920164.1 hypothetical protein [Streptosporangium saharense]